MKDSEYWLAAAASVVTLLVAWFAGRWLSLTGADLWILRIGVLGIGATGIGALVWPRLSVNSRASSDSPVKVSADKSSSVTDSSSGSLVREAENNLGRKLADMTVVLVLDSGGTSGASLVENCGLEIEQVGSAPGGRAWIAGETVLLEIKAQIYENRRLWNDLIRSLKAPRVRSLLKRGAQPARGVVLVVSTSPFTASESANEVNQLANAFRTQLRDISRSLGMPVPVYVVFTGINDLAHFEPYTSRLTEEGTSEPFGFSFSLQSEAGMTGVWAERQKKRIALGFEQLFEILSSRSLDVLTQEQSEDQRQHAYLFPREFKKLARLGPISNFLLELSRPFQLGASPYVRGFYFTGLLARAGLVAPKPTATTGKPFEYQNLTRVLSNTPSGSPPGPKHKLESHMEWIFAQRLFADVVLSDIQTLGSTFVSSRVSLVRRMALALLGGFVFTLGIALTISYLSNRRLQARVVEYGRSLPAGRLPAEQRISTGEMKVLDSLRDFVEELRSYRDSGAPWYLGLGLYSGNELYPEVRKAYFDRFRRLMLASVQGDVRAYLLSLRATPDTANAFDPAYEALKAYVITRMHPEKSTPEFLSPVLQKWWNANDVSDPERRMLAKKQFDFYSDEIRGADPPYPRLPVDDATAKTRRYLQEHFGGVDTLYGLMVNTAASGATPVKFLDLYPQAADLVVDTPDVPAAFTKVAWTRMQSLLKNPGSLASAEEWVVVMPRVDAPNLAAELGGRYAAEYAEHWSGFLRKSRVISCRAKTPGDASKRLSSLASAKSPLLGLFCVAAENTESDSPELKAFELLRKVVPQNCSRQLTSDLNEGYLNALFEITQQLEMTTPPGTDRRAAMDPPVAAAHTAVRAMKVDGEVERLLKEPIDGAGKCMPGVDVGSACAELATLKKKYPFSSTQPSEASVQEVDAFFNPTSGTIWVYLQQVLSNFVIERGGQFFPHPAPPQPIREDFLRFLNRSARIRDALYRGGTGPHLNFQVRVNSSQGISSVELRIGRTTHTYGPGQAEAKEFKWTAQDTGAELRVQASGGLNIATRRFAGPWGWVHLIDEMKIVRRSESNTVLEWVIRDRSSNEPAQINGQPLTIHLELAGGDVQILTSDIRTQLNCVSQVTH